MNRKGEPMMKKKGINQYLVGRIEEMYEETINMILRDEAQMKEFWTESGDMWSRDSRIPCNELYCRDKKQHGNGVITGGEGRRNQLDEENH